MWFGVVWFGMVRCVVWCGLVCWVAWCGLCGMVVWSRGLRGTSSDGWIRMYVHAFRMDKELHDVAQVW